MGNVKLLQPSGVEGSVKGSMHCLTNFFKKQIAFLHVPHHDDIDKFLKSAIRSDFLITIQFLIQCISLLFHKSIRNQITRLPYLQNPIFFSLYLFLFSL